MNTLENLFTPDQLKLYNSTEYPFNLQLLDEAIKLRVAEDADFEVFVPLVYCKYDKLIRDNTLPTMLTPYKYLISNKGNIASLRKKNPVIIGTTLAKSGYLRFSIPDGGNKQIKLLYHRAVACSLIPIKEELGSMHPKDLQVNHISGIKTDCAVSNLEWCTDLQNMEHAALTGLTPTAFEHYSVKPIKGTVLAGEFSGKEFLLVGTKEIVSSGFDKAAVSRCCLGLKRTHSACSFSFATPEEVNRIPRGLSDEVRESISKINIQIKSDILATNLATGEQLVIVGGKQSLLALGFDQSSVSKVIKGKIKNYKGYVFERIAA